MNTVQQPIYQAGVPGYQAMPINKVVASRGWYIAKLVLGSFIVVFDIILIAISAAYLNIYPYYSASVYFSIVFSPALVSLGWQIAEFITVCVHKDRRGIHPGAHVGLHLLLWLSFASTVGLLGLLISLHYSSFRYSTRRSYISDLEGLENAQMAFSVLNFILHFTLFVRFCIETNRRNKLPAGMIMVAAPASGMYFVPGGQPQYMAQAVPQPLGPAMATGGAYNIPQQQQYLPQQQQQHLQSGHTSLYGGFYSPGPSPADKAVEQQQQPGTAPPPAMSEVSADQTPQPPAATGPTAQ
ncbi:hypothetical protein MAPG_00839 [Magnaporthiopsis poae ATCC 64411]|uniref:Uncharacterized protein n=1 Tax=Magnaporthiopsis poae (strain ATCC 64411 / 73-15) TaxID=644358 RepID=A0A0C4DM39_MAGP6|nr:hypothetical protein MAPG_00839 [Magnaporthiopsis poae ATCC 64411]